MVCKGYVKGELAELVQFRPPVAGDVKCVLDNWLRAYRTSPWAGCVTNDQYFDVYHETIRQLLERGAKLVVACNKSDPDHVLGWSCWEPLDSGHVVHFVYVKEGLRRRGLGKELVYRTCTANPQSSWFYTFRTRASGYLFGDSQWRFAPEIVRRKKRQS